MASRTTSLRLALIAATALTAMPAFAQEQHHPTPQPVIAEPAPAEAAAPSLEAEFQNPPNAARPRVWWHWMNGNITRDGIAKDMDWMQRVGIGGLQNFDANLQTPQIVENRLVYMTPGWKDAFEFTAAEAERRGLELAIAASPGWSETGGPWVPPEDGLKKLVWSETTVAAGQRFQGVLTAPPSTTGPYQSLAMAGGIEEMLGAPHGPPPPTRYGDVAVLAYPAAPSAALVPASAHSGAGAVLDPAALGDGNLGSTVSMARSPQGETPTVVLDYGRPVTVRSAELFMPNSSMIFAGAFYYAALEASDNGEEWRKVADLTTDAVLHTTSFAAVTARQFRLKLTPRASAINLGDPAPGLAMGDMFGQIGQAMASRPIEVAELRLSGEAQIDNAETKAGFVLSQDYYALTAPADGAVGPSPEQVVDLTSRMRPGGALDWTAPALPAGQVWRVLRMGYSLLGTTNHPAPPEATGLEVDKFDGAAVRRYMDHYIGMYRDASGGRIGARGVRAILTDSIEVGAANWTPRMVEQFRRLRGYDPTPWLPALTGALIGTRADSDRFLYDYRRTLADLMSSEHYGTVAEVAHANGLMVYGEALEDHRPSLGDDMSMRRHADVPMAAMWTHSREAGPRLSYVADIKGAASVAHIYGQNLVAAESMTASLNPWNYAPNDLRRVIDLEFVTGVNRPVIHTSVHQPVDDKIPGLSLFIFGQYFNRHESWAEMAKPWVDYLSRTSYMLQAGRNFADVGYFYGEEAPLTGLYGDARVADAPKANAYDFINFDALNDALSNHGNDLMTPGGAHYRALYLGGTSRMMTLAALRRIAALVEGGATVIGLKPEGNPSLSGDKAEYDALTAKLWPGGDEARIGRGRVIASNNVDAALATIGVSPDFSYTGGQEGSEIPFIHRQLADGDAWFLVNRKNRAETIEARFRVTGRAPELWNAETGTSSPVSYRIENGETVVPLTLLAEKSIFVVFRRATTAQTWTVAEQTLAPPVAIEGRWNVAFQAGRGAPARAVLPSLASLSENAVPGIKYFSGIATYSRSLAAPQGWQPGQAAWLDLGQVAELAEVTVNGRLAGSVWQAPYRLDIGPMLRRGRNQITVRVANTWVNRLTGDAGPGGPDTTWTAMPTYRADAPLRPSGLIGPVTISVESR